MKVTATREEFSPISVQLLITNQDELSALYSLSNMSDTSTHRLANTLRLSTDETHELSVILRALFDTLAPYIPEE